MFSRISFLLLSPLGTLPKLMFLGDSGRSQENKRFHSTQLNLLDSLQAGFVE